jgi:hypothetical protein
MEAAALAAGEVNCPSAGEIYYDPDSFCLNPVQGVPARVPLQDPVLAFTGGWLAPGELDQRFALTRICAPQRSGIVRRIALLRRQTLEYGFAASPTSPTSFSVILLAFSMAALDGAD